MTTVGESMLGRHVPPRDEAATLLSQNTLKHMKEMTQNTTNHEPALKTLRSEGTELRKDWKQRRNNSGNEG